MNESKGSNIEPDGMFPTSVGFNLHFHQVKGPQRMFEGLSQPVYHIQSRPVIVFTAS